MAFLSGKLGKNVIVLLFTDEGITGMGEATVITEWVGDHGKYFGESQGLPPS